MAEKRYSVTASKNSYVSASYDTAEGAIEAATRLINEGYAMVSIRDSETEDGDIW